ncbi:MAG: TonB-dependent receptor [Deinococcales bacterium]|nr:TonB-dependent receptor [Chitinophagaceae bacterium]
MKKILYFTIVILLISQKSFSQNISGIKPLSIEILAKASLKGTITDAATGKPLQGAAIFLHDIKVGVTSDIDGNYTLTNISSGKHLIEISYIGYTTIIESIDIEAVTVKNFALKETAVEQEAVTVTGVASATKTKLSPQPVSIIKKTDLLQTSSSNIIDALAKLIPGISGLSTGPAIAKPVIRGLGYNRVVTVHDGIRQEGQQWGDEHGIEVDEYSVQRVEVLKGPASLMYGSDAMAGVVHLITNIPVEQGTVKANILGSFLDNNGLYGGNANIAAHFKNGINFNVYGTYKSAADYKNKYDGKVLNSRFNERNFGGYIGIKKAWGYSHLLVSNFNQKVGVVEGERDINTGEFLVNAGTIDEHTANNNELNSRDVINPYQYITHFKIASDNNIAIGKGRLAINLGYQRNQRRELGDYTAPATPNLFFNLETINYSVQYLFAEKNGFKTAIGTNGMYQQNSNKGEKVLIPAYNQFDIGLYLTTKKTFNKLTISGGIRTDYRHVTGKKYLENTNLKFSAFNKNFGNTSGSIGVSYNASEAVTLKLNIARGYRSPGVSELSSNGTHEGTNRYEYGDVNLKTETSFQIDGGIDVNLPHISFGVSTFYNNINNYIFYSKLEAISGADSLVDDGAGNLIQAFKFQQSIASLYGFEAKLDIHPHPLDWLHFENSFSLVAGQFNQSYEGSNKLPFIPSPRLQSVLRGNFKNIGKALKNVYLKFEMDNVAQQNRVFTAYNTETPTNGYTLFNIGAGTEFTCKGKTLFSLNLGLNNITDVAYQNHLSRLKYAAENTVTGRNGVFNMGRNFSLKINVPLSFKM